MTTHSTISQELQRRLNQLETSTSVLDGMRLADSNTLEEARKTVSEAKGRQALHDEVGRVFTSLQQRALGRSVGAFEELLTSLLQDVLPEEGSVRLIPEFKNSTTSLDILLEKPNGKLEDVLEGNGGAVTNVLSAGLRFAALARSKNRAMLVLDEPDCWLKPTRVPAFLKVISEVASNGFQTFLVTHHDDLSSVEGLLNIVEFTKDDNGIIKASLVPPAIRQWANDEEPGIRKIELINFGPHLHTVIPCYPGATVFTGENNLGKSFGMSGALRALAYGESKDSQINHDADFCQAIYHLENHQRIEVTRYRDKSPAVMYRLYEGDNPKPVKEGRQPKRNSVPDWVEERVGITRIDNLDVQLKSQKSPVFLLDESGPTQAKILAVGKESSYLDLMMKRYEELRTSDREAVKHGEASVMRLTYRLNAFKDLDRHLDKLCELFVDLQDVQAQVNLLVALQNMAERVAASQEAFRANTAAVQALSKLPKPPVLADAAPLEVALGKIERHQVWQHVLVPLVPDSPILTDVTGLATSVNTINQHRRMLTALANIPEIPVAPELQSVEELGIYGKKITRFKTEFEAASQMVEILSRIPEVPQLADLAEMERVAGTLSKARTEFTNHSKGYDDAKTQLDEVNAEIARITEELGGVCPVCRSPLNHSHEEAHV